MKKSILFAAVAALVLGACTKTETYTSQTLADAVSFGAYSGRTVTKAGPTDDMNNDALKQHGFGVFATYTGTDAFEDAANDAGVTNDFMYNQLVNYKSSVWTYSPIKYWPNPTNGQSADKQKVSFFAYAPYADPEKDGADNSYGITGFSKAVANDNPNDATSPKHLHNIVNYTFAKDKPNVDLMWGYKVKNVDNTDPANPKVTYDINNNLTRTTDKVKFIFQHVLSKLGGSQEGGDPVLGPDDPNYVANGLMIKANAETIKPTNDFGTANGTKITVSRIVVKSAPTEDPVGTPVVDANGKNVSYATGAQTGKLDLYTGEFTLDSTPQALQFSQTLTTDPAEISANPATADSEIAERIAEPSSFNTWTDLTQKGVTDTAVNVYKDESNPIILVPGTAPVVDVQVTYTVRTFDEKLGSKKCSEVVQTVWNRVKFPTIEKNKKYNLLMILGLNDVKLEASVEDWTVVGSTWNDANGNGVVDPGEVTGTDQQTWLPENL